MKSKPFVLTIFLVLMLIGCIERKEIYKPGTYKGSSEGYYSKINVEVEVDEFNIISIEILDNQEPPTLASIVFETLPSKIIKKNETAVDAVSGATFTSKALLDAVENALENARGDSE